MSQGISDDDWRLAVQKDYLLDGQLVWQRWVQQTPNWDHDHCAFCWAKFMEREGPEFLHEGYYLEAENHWVCVTCARDFASRFRFSFVGGPLAPTGEMKT